MIAIAFLFIIPATELQIQLVLTELSFYELILRTQFLIDLPLEVAWIDTF